MVMNIWIHGTSLLPTHFWVRMSEDRDQWELFVLVHSQCQQSVPCEHLKSIWLVSLRRPIGLVLNRNRSQWEKNDQRPRAYTLHRGSDET